MSPSLEESVDEIMEITRLELGRGGADWRVLARAANLLYELKTTESEIIMRNRRAKYSKISKSRNISVTFIHIYSCGWI